MRAVCLDFEQQTLLARDVAEPRRDLAPEEVLFQIASVGVCGTDRDLADFIFGSPPAGERYMTIGHEAAGRVLDVGSAVDDIHPGDCVVPLVRRPCAAACGPCSTGRTDLCLTGGYTERGIMRAHGYFTEFAVDHHADLIVVPEMRAAHAILIEPLSVVEKAVQRAFELRAWPPESALVIGGGSIGILSALTLRERGLQVVIQSIEPENSSRAKLIQTAGIEYTRRYTGKADIIIEAAGSPAAISVALDCLGPLGVLVVLGVRKAQVDMPFLQMILQNQAVVGSVNTSPEAAAAAAEDLLQFDPAVLDGMITRVPFDAFRETILGPAGESPKIVHMLD